MYRVMIADDEPIECVALEHKIRELLPELVLLPSVNDGISLLKSVTDQKPDIAIVDINMPGLSGLEAIELLKMKEVHLKIIINTSYSDFAYIQQALRLGASDYLLKPGSRRALGDALKKVCAELDREHEAEKQKGDSLALMSSLRKVAEEKWMISLVHGVLDEECHELLAKENPQIDGGGYFTAWIFRQEEGVDPRRADEILKAGCRELCCSVGAFYQNISYIFFMKPPCADPEEEQDSMREIFDYLRMELRENGINASVACSRYKENRNTYVAGVKEAGIALGQIHRSGVYFFRFDEEKKVVYLFTDMADGIAGDLLRGETQDCMEKIREICMKNPEILDGGIEELKSQMALLLTEVFSGGISLFRTEKTADIQLPVPVSFWPGLRDADTMEKLMAWTARSLEDTVSAWKKSQQQENIYIQKAMIYLNERFREDISLNDLAEELKISPFYLSRMFKQERDSSFVEILTDLRVREAIRLLHTTHLSNREISSQIGYASTTYFYRVFKKTTGFTVSEIRKLR